MNGKQVEHVWSVERIDKTYIVFAKQVLSFVTMEHRAVYPARLQKDLRRLGNIQGYKQQQTIQEKNI